MNITGRRFDPGRAQKSWEESMNQYSLVIDGAKVPTQDHFEVRNAKSLATLTPPVRCHSALISLEKIGVEGVIYRVQP